MVDYATISLPQTIFLFYLLTFIRQSFVFKDSVLLFLIFYFNLTTPADWFLYSGAVEPADA